MIRFLAGLVVGVVLAVAAQVNADVESAWGEGRPATVCTYSWEGFDATIQWWSALYATTPGFRFGCKDPDLTLVLSTCYWYNPTWYACYDGNIGVAWAPTRAAMLHEIGHALGLGHAIGYDENSGCGIPWSVMDKAFCPGQDVISPADITAVLIRIVARAEIRAR